MNDLSQAFYSLCKSLNGISKSLKCSVNHKSHSWVLKLDNGDVILLNSCRIFPSFQDLPQVDQIRILELWPDFFHIIQTHIEREIERQNCFRRTLQNARDLIPRGVALAKQLPEVVP